MERIDAIAPAGRAASRRLAAWVAPRAAIGGVAHDTKTSASRPTRLDACAAGEGSALDISLVSDRD